jgi:hypothetical protein
MSYYAELRVENERLRTDNERLRQQRDALLKALKPFALNVEAVSLNEALGHIERQHLLDARAAIKLAEQKGKSS